MKTAIVLGLITLFPVLVLFWAYASRFSPRINDKVKLPGRSVEHYVTFKDAADKARWSGRNTVPIHSFSELYVDGKADFNGDCLDVLEYRHDSSNFSFTWDLFKYILFTFGPDVLLHTRDQDMSRLPELRPRQRPLCLVSWPSNDLHQWHHLRYHQRRNSRGAAGQQDGYCL